MRKLFNIDQDEKNRILEMHENATKRHYLNEYSGVAFGDEQNGLKIDATEQYVQGTTQEPTNIGPEQTTKIQKIDNLLNLASQTPQAWANSFESKYQIVPGASWYLNDGQPAFDRASGNPGYVKVGSNLNNYKKMENLITSGKAKGPEAYYILSSYVSPPLPNSTSQNYAFNNPQDVKKYGLTPPEKDDVYTIAKSAIDSMVKNTNASSLLSMGEFSTDQLLKGLPTSESSYNKVRKFSQGFTNSVPKITITANTAKQKIKNPKTIFPPEQEKKLEYLFKYMA